MDVPKCTFLLKFTSVDFAQRQRSIFDQLKVLENRTNYSTNSDNDPMDVDDQIENNRKSQRSLTKHLRGRESIFKKPQNPAPKHFMNRIPDFKKHPHKWTKYSLDDVKDEDLSDTANTRAALAFLEELKSRKINDNENTEQIPTKIIFQKHTSALKSKDELNDEESTPSFRSSKVVMPEYVVGQKGNKDKKNRRIQAETVKQLKLDHLLQNDDE